MNTESIIKSLNLADGDILILEKAKDRMEFEALPVMSIVMELKGNGPCKCWAGYLCDEWCVIDVPCDCKGPVGYFNCRPFTDCPSNNCRPVQ